MTRAMTGHKVRRILRVRPVWAGREAKRLDSSVVLRRAPSFLWLGYAACCAVFDLITSWVVFNRAEASFAESI